MLSAPSPSLQELEPILTRLTPAEQLWLLDFLIQRLREIIIPPSALPLTSPAPSLLDERDPELESMAQSLEIQHELAAINHEFADTELDGLATL